MTPAITSANTSAITPATLAEALSALLGDFSSVYRLLRSNVQSHREAIQRADANAIAQALEQQQTLARNAATCDQRRRELVARSVRAFPTLANSPQDKVTLSDLARCAPDSLRGQLMSAAAALRTLVSTVAAESASLRSATITLMAHMEGLVRQVGRSLSHAGTYSRRGVVEAGSPVLSAVDLAG